MDESEEIAEIDVDVAWIRDWVADGLAELELYLARHAAFEDYLRRRDSRYDR